MINDEYYVLETLQNKAELHIISIISFCIFCQVFMQ